MIIPPIPVANFAQLLLAEAVASKIESYAPVGADTGGETWFDGSGAFVCPDAVSWQRVWDTHIKNESLGNTGRVGNLNPPPTVDFKKNVVVALFAGPTKGVVGYRVTNGFKLGQEAVIRLAPVVNNSSAANVAVPRPWAFLILKRTNANVSIQTFNGNAWVTITKLQPKPDDAG